MALAIRLKINALKKLSGKQWNTLAENTNAYRKWD